MRVIRAILLAGMGLLPLPGLAATVVAVDPGFAPVASELGRMFTAATGHPLELAVAPPAALAMTLADVLLAPDAVLPAELAASGRAAADSVMTYAMGATGTAGATAPRDAVILTQGEGNPVARAFLDFLLTPEVWDVIVAHGFGAH